MSNNEVISAAQKIAEEKIVIFSLGEELYGLPIAEVKEVTGILITTTIPNVPDYIIGLIDVRGEVMILIDMQKRFNLALAVKHKKQHTLICELEGKKLGILVDKVKGIISIPSSTIQTPDRVLTSKIDASCIKGMTLYEKKALVILNILGIMTAKDIKLMQKAV